MQVSHEFFELLFLIMMGCCAIFIVIMIPLWLLLSIFTPKQLLTKFFKEPHFTQTELIMMAGFPFFLMRTAMFGWGLLIPSLDRKRNIKDIGKFMPVWYRVLLNFLTIGVVLLGLTALGILACSFLLQPTN